MQPLIVMYISTPYYYYKICYLYSMQLVSYTYRKNFMEGAYFKLREITFDWSFKNSPSDIYMCVCV